MAANGVLNEVWTTSSCSFGHAWQHHGSFSNFRQLTFTCSSSLLKVPVFSVITTRSNRMKYRLFPTLFNAFFFLRDDRNNSKGSTRDTSSLQRVLFTMRCTPPHPRLRNVNRHIDQTSTRFVDQTGAQFGWTESKVQLFSVLGNNVNKAFKSNIRK